VLQLSCRDLETIHDNANHLQYVSIRRRQIVHGGLHLALVAHAAQLHSRALKAERDPGIQRPIGYLHSAPAPASPETYAAIRGKRIAKLFAHVSI
jgi:hypothetical protein